MQEQNNNLPQPGQPSGQQPKSQPAQPAGGPPQPQDEKLEFLKRAEVRTMEKDTARVREVEAAKERKRIAGGPAAPQEPAQQQVEQQEQEIKKSLIPKKRLTAGEKVIIRLIVGGFLLFIVFNAGAFGYWYFTRTSDQPQAQAPPPAPAPAPAPQPAPTPAPEPTPEPTPEPPAPQASQVAFFATPESAALEVTETALLPTLDAFLDQPPAVGFTRITLTSPETEQLLSFKEFLQGTAISVPENVQSLLGEEYMLFSYVAGGKNRLGLVVERVGTEDLASAVSLWEQSFEQNTKTFFDIIGGKGSAYTPSFRSSVYQEVPIRFQTFSVIDFGIVYGIMEKHFLLTSSFESMRETINNIVTNE